jgi:hypothetical protein
MRALTCVFIGLLAAGAVWAGDADLMKEIEMTRAITDAERKALVAEAMQLDEGESQVFWKLYRDYRAEMAGVGDRMVDLIVEYGQSYTKLSNAQAAEMLDEWLSIEEEAHKVRRQHVKKFRKELSESTVLQFFQIDNKLTQLIRVQLAAEIPVAP